MASPERATADPARVAEVFAEAVERAPTERSAFLDAACAGAPELRAEVESLLSAEDRAGDFLDGLDTDRGAALLEVTPEPEPVGRRVGPYRILNELGRGGMGIVYLAERAEGGFEQRVAVKLIKRGMDSDAILRRFLRERQILASLEHPNVARLLDGGVSEDGQPYFAMEYVDGEPLTAYCDGRRLATEERLRLFEHACRAVQHAHAKLVVHRDLKPSNMLVTGQGELKLLDFGIAKLLAEEEGETATALTQVGVRPQTPDYAAPEQVRGEPVTTATDVYALGVVLYELLSGQRPYAGKRTSREELARAICETEPRPPSAAVTAQPRLSRRLRGDLDTVVLKALSKEPARRYPSAEALAEDVRRYLAGHPVQARPDSVRYRSAKFIRRHRVGVSAAAIATLSLVVGLLGASWQARVAARERDRARQEAARAERVKEFLVGIFKASDPAESRGKDVTARELLERGTQRIEKELAGQPSLQAEVLHTMSGSFTALGRYDRARALEERSLELLRQARGPEHPEVARGLEALGGILQGSGDLAGSEDVRRKALAMRRRLLPPDSPDVAESLAGLGSVLADRRKLEEAEAVQREALAIRQKRFGLEHADTAQSMVHLASVLDLKDDFAGAVELHRQAVLVQRKLHGDLHPDVAFALSNLGAALGDLGDLAGAEAARREALELRRKLFGEEHPLVAMSLNALAVVLDNKGDLEAAETVYRQSLALDRKLSGEHPSVAMTLTNLAYTLAEQARFEEAMPLFDEAAVMHRRLSGADHPLLAITLFRKAGALIDQGRSREALPLLDQSLAINRARYGAASPRVASVLASLAKARAELGEPAEAEKVFREALDLQRRAWPQAHRAKVRPMAGLAELLMRQGRAAEAEPLLRDALRQAEEAMPVTHWHRSEVESVLGACLWQLGRREEGRPSLVRGYERLRDTRGAQHPATRKARQRLEVVQGKGL